MTKAVDQHVGRVIQKRREKMAMSPDALAARIGVTDIDVIEFEHGLKRVSASRLYLITRVLETHVADFFEGVSV